MSTLYRVRSSIVVSAAVATLVLAGVAGMEMAGQAPAAVPAMTPAAAPESTAPMLSVARAMPAEAVFQAQDDLALVGASIANYDR